VQSYDRSLDFGFMADGQALPDVRELADAIVIAFDDLRALARPGEPDPEEAPPPGVVGRAARGFSDVVTGATGVVTGAMGKVARQVMTTAVETAVSQVTGRGAARAPAKRRAAAGNSR
jgi:hypothetical protein